MGRKPSLQRIHQLAFGSPSADSIRRQAQSHSGKLPRQLFEAATNAVVEATDTTVQREKASKWRTDTRRSNCFSKWDSIERGKQLEVIEYICQWVDRDDDEPMQERKSMFVSSRLPFRRLGSAAVTDRDRVSLT